MGGETIRPAPTAFRLWQKSRRIYVRPRTGPQSAHLFAFQQCVGQARKVHETTTLLLVTLPGIHRFEFFFTHTLSNKPFLNLVINNPTTPQICALPCNLSLMACFADINVSQGSVATYARCGEMFNIHLAANLLRNLSVKKNVNRLKFDRIVVKSLWLRFLAHPV